MTAYDIMIKTNHYLIKGEQLTENQKANIVDQLLSFNNTVDHIHQIYDSVKLSNNTINNRSKLYPIFFIPPYNDGKKFKTIFNQTPKTQILSANMYELEILRLLYLFVPENPYVKFMVDETLNRLKSTCFGYQDDGLGECFDASLVVLRFISTVALDEIDWIKNRIDNYNNHVNEKKRPWFSSWYFWLCLSEMPYDIAKDEIEKYKEVMLNWLYNKSCIMNSEHDKMIHPVIISMLRNIISKYPEYKYIRERKPYVSDKDGRLHFNMAL